LISCRSCGSLGSCRKTETAAEAALVTLYQLSNTARVLLSRPNPATSVPIYVQIIEQIKHAIETGALRAGEQLAGIRPLAEQLAINPNTVAKAYRELEHEGVIEIRHGAGAYVAGNARSKRLTDKMRAGQVVARQAVARLRSRGLGDDEIRRLFEAELVDMKGTAARRA